MNENEMQKKIADPCDPTECDPLPSKDEEAIVTAESIPAEDIDIPDVATERGVEEVLPTNSSDVPSDPSDDLEISADSDSNPDPDSSASVEATPEEQLHQLRNELTRLRQAIAQQDAILSHMGEECREFQVLYPETPLSELPDNVWDDVKRGIPLAAAYALAERRRVLTEALATTQNRKNDQRSSGSLEATDPDYFSPNEVRAMSQKEVRTNYQKIMRSMQKWR